MLGPLEREVVSVLEHRRAATTRQVLSDLRARNRNVAYTTVSTILTRLHAKGLIDRDSESFKGGQRYVYRYKDIEDAYISDLLGGLVATFGPEGIAHLSQRIEGLSSEDVVRLRERRRA